MNLTEAFKAFNALNEETFSVSDDGIEKLSQFEDNDDLDDTLSVIDTEAETEEDLQDSYLGKVILDCCVCHSKLYKDKDDITIDNEEDLANVGDECPYCASSDGYKIIGEVGKFEDSEDTESEENPDETDEEESDNDKESEETNESLKRIRSRKLKEATTKTKPQKNMSEIEGTLGNVFTKHSKELSMVHDKQSALDFLDKIEPEVKNKSYLDKVKKDIMKIRNSIKVTEYLYNIILKGDKMGTKIESFNQRRRSRKLTESSFEDSYNTDYRYYVYNVSDNVVSDPFQYQDEAIEFAIDNNYPVVKIHRYFYDDSGKINPDGDPEIVWSDDTEDFDESLKTRKFRRLKEDVKEMSLTTDDTHLELNTDENGNTTLTTGPVTSDLSDSDEVLTPLSDETKTDIENNDIDNPEDDIDVDVDEFDEDSFDDLGESYFRKIYENVNRYKTTKVTSKGNSLIIEGLLKFKSGKTKKTSFIFEAKDYMKNGKARFIGENVQLTKGKKSFIVDGIIKDKKFISESFRYNYKASDNTGNKRDIRGSIKR